MPRACQICNHPERLAIDREIVSGKSKTLIAREFGVSADSVGHHAENHLSRQLTKAWEKKDLAESTDLLGRIDKIIDRAEKIFTRNYDKNNMGGDTLALKALAEQRSTLELLCKISAYLHEGRLLELQNNQDRFQQEREAQYAEQLKRLTDDELEVLEYLQVKMEGEELEEWLIPEIFKAPASPVSVPKLPQKPPPLPRPKTPPTTVCKPVYAPEEPDPGPTPGLEEPEPEKPRGLPPQHFTEIKEASREEQRRFVDELRGGGVRRR